MKTFVRFSLIAIKASDDFKDCGDVYVDPQEIQVIAPSLYGDDLKVRPGFAHLHLKVGPPITVKGSVEDNYQKLIAIDVSSKLHGEIKYIPTP